MAVTETYALEDVRTEFRVNSETSGTEVLSNVIALANGAYAVVYADTSSDDRPELEIFSSATATTPISVGASLNNGGGGTAGLVGEPVLTQLSDGNIAVVWKEGSFGDNKVVATIVNSATGEVIATEVEIGSSSVLTDPEVAALNSGFVVAMQNGANVLVGIYDNSGTSSTGVSISGASDPAVAGLADGRFVVTYVSGGDIKARVFLSNGQFDNTVPEQSVASAGTGSPQVAALNDGGFAVVFADTSFEDGSGEHGIGLRLYTAAITSAVIRVDGDVNPGNQDFDPEITVLDNGFTMVTWTMNDGSSDTSVRGRIFTVDGTPATSTFTLDDGASAAESQTSVAALTGGQFIATWSDPTPPGDSNEGISARIHELVRTIQGDGAGDFLVGSSLRDKIFGDAGDDTLTVDGDHVTAGDSYDGGADSDALQLSTFGALGDLRSVTIAEFERLDLPANGGGSPPSVFRFTAQQIEQFSIIRFHAGGFPIVFSDETVEVFMGALTTLSLSGVAIASASLPNSFFRIFGDGDSETITGSSIADRIESSGGNDTLTGGGGIDTLVDASGNDTFHLENGTDNVIDSSGIDTVTSTITRTLSGMYAEIEKLTLLGNANIKGTGNGLANTMTGNARVNTLDGKAGNDILKGLAGNDTLIGNAGRDTQTGGTGSDTFAFLSKTHSPNNAQRDIITDFDKGGTGDRIDVSKLFGPKMAYIHNAAFSAAGQVRINDIAGPDVIVEANTGGSLAADFSVRLKATTLGSMNQGDFIL
jgi:hypothetical protein